MGTDTLTDEKKLEYEKILATVDWNLPGMEKFDAITSDWLTRLILDGQLVNSIVCLGWGFWPTQNRGYLNDYYLRILADFIEIQNKPFWDEYEDYVDSKEATEDIHGWGGQG